MHPLYVREMQMRNVYSIIFEPIVSFNEGMEPVQCIAESWKYDEEANLWTIQLRANAHWHGDLGELTGDDAAFTINSILADPESIYYADLSYYVERAEGVGNTLYVYPKVKSYALIYALNIPVIPRAYYEGKSKTTKDIPLGSGCFKVDSLTFQNETKMELSTFTNWWKKLPYISNIVAIGYNNTDEMLKAFKEGQLDCAPTAVKTTEIYEILEGVDEKSYLSHNYVFLAFNLERTKMENKDFRKAIAYAIERTNIINNVYLTKATGAEQPLFNDMSLSSASVIRYDHNEVHAQTLLSNLGYVDNDGDGFFDSPEGPLTLDLLVLSEPSNPVRLEAAEYIQKDLEKVGIKVNIDAKNEKDLKKAIEKRAYDMILSGYYLSDTPNLNFAFQANGRGNLSGYSSQDANNALFGIDIALSIDELKNAVRNLQNILADELPQIGLFFEMNTFLFRDKLSVGTILRETQIYSTINTWHFKK
ncbi:MAG: hypothetical protein J6Q67_08550 [Clostridia bacterium]|nr:hypothetical protein [Clostridia bacterium]